jgi:hypothetical protein
MKIVTCPYCGIRVFPNIDNICPSCHKVILLTGNIIINENKDSSGNRNILKLPNIINYMNIASKSNIEMKTEYKWKLGILSRLFYRLYGENGELNLYLWLFSIFWLCIIIIEMFIFQYVFGIKVIQEPFRSLTFSLIPLFIMFWFGIVYKYKKFPLIYKISISGINAKIIGILGITIFLYLFICILLLSFRIHIFPL